MIHNRLNPWKREDGNAERPAIPMAHPAISATPLSCLQLRATRSIYAPLSYRLPSTHISRQRGSPQTQKKQLGTPTNTSRNLRWRRRSRREGEEGMVHSKRELRVGRTEWNVKRSAEKFVFWHTGAPPQAHAGLDGIDEAERTLDHERFRAVQIGSEIREYFCEEGLFVVGCMILDAQAWNQGTRMIMAASLRRSRLQQTRILHVEKDFGEAAVLRNGAAITNSGYPRVRKHMSYQIWGKERAWRHE
ncbi:hypothetical protein R3P38DRAFT_2794043 [Favolaschia claudopus]|uniref:Uncharacterized protein n=1 Tax=Favolaschia claudopus TaxID=2862362 RepID=A0AAW0ABC2_9AGAR